MVLTIFHFIYELTICFDAAIFGKLNFYCFRLFARAICLKAIFNNQVFVMFRQFLNWCEVCHFFILLILLALKIVIILFRFVSLKCMPRVSFPVLENWLKLGYGFI